MVLDCSSKVNAYKPALYFAVTLCLTATKVEFSSLNITTTMSDSQSLNTSLLVVMISSKNDGICIRDLNDLTLQIISEALWACRNAGSKRLIA